MAGATRILITGATGFVGSHTLQALAARGAPLRALVRPTSDVRLARELAVELRTGGLEDPSSLARAIEGADVVLHLAALTRARTPAEFERTNHQGTRALVQAILAANPRPRRLVYLSSLAAVGPSRNGHPVTTADAPRPLTAYGRSKLAGEQACLAAAGRLEVVIMRAPAVYGPRDRDLYTFFRLAARGLLPVPGGPDRPIQLVHARDLAESLARAATVQQAAGVYHVAHPRPYVWVEVARAIAHALGRSARVVRVPPALVRGAAAATELASALAGRATIFDRDKARELLAPGWLCETEAAKRDLGFEAQIALPEGLAETAAWYRAQGWL